MLRTGVAIRNITPPGPAENVRLSGSGGQKRFAGP